MTTLSQITDVFRSKNAGPFQITIDLMFADRGRFDRVLGSPAFTVENIASRYGVAVRDVAIIPFERALAIKVTLPRIAGTRGSGSPGDRDVYGAQQHGPMLDIVIKEESS